MIPARPFPRLALVLLVCLAAARAAALIDYSNRFRSPRNPERAIRPTTELIVLHTTEAPAKSSLNKLSDRGEAHFCVVEDGTVYRIVDRDREAFHAGRSMWNGKANVDSFSIGIEVVGFHDRPVTREQLAALRELVQELQGLYHIDDAHVVCHSHVAYGAPNRWQRRSHRGRKRCGMLFAMPSVRTKLGLSARPAYDPDVRAGRLVQADDYLGRVLYGRVDTMARYYGGGSVTAVAPTPVRASGDTLKAPATAPARGPLSRLGGMISSVVASRRAPAAAKPAPPPAPPDDGITITRTRSAYDIAHDAFDSPTTVYVYPDGTKIAGNCIRNFRTLIGVKVLVAGGGGDDRPETYRTIGIDGKTLEDLAGDEAYTPRVIFVRPNGTYGHGSDLTRVTAAKLPYGTKVLVGYAVGGPVSKSLNAVRICGGAWKSPNTFYLISRALVAGDQVDEKRISVGTMIFYRN